MVNDNLKNTIIIIIIFLFFSLLIIYLFNSIPTSGETYKDNIILNNLLSTKNKIFSTKKPLKTFVLGPYKDITISPYGCFTNLKDQFFFTTS